MNQQISAQEGALAKGATAVNEAKQGIDREAGKVRGEIEQLASYWTGDASLAFTSLLNQWDEKARALNNVLVTLEDGLRGTARDQEASEAEHQSTISGLTGLLG